MNNMLNRPWLVFGVGALVVGGVVAAQNFRPTTKLFGGSPIQLQPAGLNTGVDLSGLKQLDSTFSALAEAASQGVVFIAGEAVDKAQNDPMVALQGSKSGSGFIYRSDGWIVTNDHVVNGYDKVKVVLGDGREVTGKVTRANDPQLDLALVKVDERDLPALSLADSSKIRLGQIAMAIGAPFGLDDSVTFGHVSAMGRPGAIPDPSTGQVRVYSGLIQTDAAINPGNSGGPLLNINGEVIGVNSAINSQTGSNNGVGFAIPANIVRAVADELISSGKFDRGLLGVNPRDLKPFEKKQFNMQGGAYALAVESSTPAYKAGLREKDIVTAIDGQPVTGEIDLRVAMYRSSPGKTVQVTYVRNGKTNTANVTLSAPQIEANTQPRMNRQEQFPTNPYGFFNQDKDKKDDSSPSSTPQSGKPRLGVMVQQVDANARKQFDLPSDLAGVVIATVNDGSFAAKVNLMPGDVMLELNGKRISTVDDVTAAMNGVDFGDQVTLKFVRFKNGARSEYTVTVPFK